MLTKWLIKLIDERIKFERHSLKTRYVTLTEEDKESLHTSLKRDLLESINYRLTGITGLEVKRKVTEVVHEVIDRTEVIEKLVNKVNNVQLNKD